VLEKNFRVSVIITSYNQKRYLIEAIESVINQTVKPHEIIIADDHSTDGESQEIIRDYMLRYPGWIKGIFQEKNVWIPRNRNSALSQVTGDYVEILDGDDRFSAEKLERERAALRDHPAARCVYSNISFVDSEGQFLRIRDQSVQPSGDIFPYIAQGTFGLLRSMLIDYTLLREIGFLNVDLPHYDGFELTLRLARQAPFVYLFDPLLEYRTHNTSSSSGLKAKTHVHDLDLIYRLLKPWLTVLPPEARERIITQWQQRLLRFRLRAACEEKSRVRAYAVLLAAMINKDQIKHQDLRQIARSEFPGLWPMSQDKGRQR